MKKAYAIGQLPDGHENLFMNYNWTLRHGGWDLDEYECVWKGEIDVSPNDSASDTLERIYAMFNGEEKPEGYAGRSLSVSDVVEIEGRGVWFCDSIGFRKMEV